MVLVDKSYTTWQLSLRSSHEEGSIYASVGIAALCSADETHQALS
jgi:hypothetical protein